MGKASPTHSSVPSASSFRVGHQRGRANPLAWTDVERLHPPLVALYPFRFHARGMTSGCPTSETRRVLSRFLFRLRKWKKPLEVAPDRVKLVGGVGKGTLRTGTS